MAMFITLLPGIIAGAIIACAIAFCARYFSKRLVESEFKKAKKVAWDIFHESLSREWIEIYYDLNNDKEFLQDYFYYLFGGK